MYFSQLNIPQQCYMMALYIVCFTLLLITIIAYIQFYKSKKAVLPLVILLLFTIIETSVMKEMNHFHTIQNEFTPVAKILDKIPVWRLVILGIFAIIYCIYRSYKLYIYRKTMLNPYSVKEAIENLPMGIAFATQNGTLLLSNRTFNKLSHLLTDKDLQNGEEFWNDITTQQNSNLCTVKGNEPIFSLPNGEVWKFSKTVCTLEHLKCYQLKADDITDIYNLSEDLKEVNAKLTEQQETLQELFENIEYNVNEQVALNMRVKFHDNFGNLTTLTKKSLGQDLGVEKTKELLALWEGIVDSLDTHTAKNYDQSLKLEQIENFAIKLGCEFFIAGELPKEEVANQLMLLAINEMLKNAVYHGGADKLFVSFKVDTMEYLLEVRNTNIQHISVLKEGGGLSGLRRKIEQAKGSMHIAIGEDVVLRLALPKEKEVTYV